MLRLNYDPALIRNRIEYFKPFNLESFYYKGKINISRELLYFILVHSLRDNKISFSSRAYKWNFSQFKHELLHFLKIHFVRWLSARLPFASSGKLPGPCLNPSNILFLSYKEIFSMHKTTNSILNATQNSRKQVNHILYILLTRNVLPILLQF